MRLPLTLLLGCLAIVDLCAFSLMAAARQADCGNPQTQAEMTLCAGQDYQRADAELNALWGEVSAQARDNDRLAGEDGRPGYAETLLKAQRAWISFRDANCTYEGFAARGGSMEPMLASQCLARMTTERTEQLRQLMQDLGTQ